VPHAVCLLHSAGSGENASEIERIAPFTAGLAPMDGRSAAYICENRTCHPPVTDAESLRAILIGLSHKMEP